MNSGATDEQIGGVVSKIQSFGLDANVSRGMERTVIGALGDERTLDPEMFNSLGGVEYSMHVVKQYKIVSRESHKHDSIINIGGTLLGGAKVQVIGGPCSVETQEQMDVAAQHVSDTGCKLMRGGAFKPRTSPYTFQGNGEEGLRMFRKAADKYNLRIVTELMDARMLDTFMKYDVDVIQIGTRSMQNFELLKEVGRINKPVILKRGMSATISEWLMAAEYIAAGGNHNIIFCERGIRTFETAYRNVMDVTCIPVLKKETHMPVIVDPSHAGGKTWMVPALARAAIAAGADGLLVEMHPNPCEAWCDADQALNPQEFASLMGSLRGIAEVIGRSL
ncbi:3-deoxy-D-arabinoheptulosonate-7-phosphate synthase [Nitrosovibrio tenuis]|uniref:3-deoxy-D-arabinoheptulosonate-7-phosphate synthase n=2 Tax=Nitrosovibrio tenuis TaxID=1233 RepID=A0A1H7K0W3_9PROT|nr:3-deoxy-D-arabinoheptulosonate-7-phosphate synthase [Nitrosovibrio tenuis]